MMTVSMATMRRIRIRSWKDLVIIVILTAVVLGLQYVLEEKFCMEVRKAKMVSGAVGVILAIIFVFAISGD